MFKILVLCLANFDFDWYEGDFSIDEGSKGVILHPEVKIENLKKFGVLGHSKCLKFWFYDCQIFILIDERMISG